MAIRAVLFGLSGVLLSACGSDDGTGLYGNSSTGGARNEDGGVPLGSGGSSTASGDSGGLDGDGGLSSGGNVSATGGVPGTGGASGNGGAPPDASLNSGGAPSGDASPDVASPDGSPTAGTIACVGVPCVINAAPPTINACCVAALPFPTQCLPLCANGGVPVMCDDAADCPSGQICCGTPTSGAACSSSCQGTQLCRTSAECVTGTCLPSPENAEYSTCQ